MNGALIKGNEKFIGNFLIISSWCVLSISAFAIVLAELWKKEDDDDDSYSPMAVNPTALKSQVKADKVGFGIELIS